MPRVIIDAHHHFWQYNARDYGWMSDAMGKVRRDFGPADLRREAANAGVDGVVSVQARQSIEETNWLLDLAEQNADFIRGVVGWAPLIAPDIEGVLERLSQRTKMRSIRHVLHDEADDRYMLREDFNRGVSLLRRFNLAYDVLIFARHLPQTIEFVDRHPDQIFVVDHIAKPRIKEGVLSPWRENLRELGQHENVYCKVSGMVTEADWNAWTPAQLRPYFDGALEAFGPARLMFGSDWPVCLLASDYRRWREVVEDFATELSRHEQADLMGKTAARAYSL